MTKFYDGKKILSISMKDTNTNLEWENDFFDVGSLSYNSYIDAYKVDDVNYLVDYAVDYANGTNTDIDYEHDDNGDIILPAVSVDYTVEDM